MPARKQMVGSSALQMGIEGTGLYIGTSLYGGQWKMGVGPNLCV
jgi:hypothetical protein